jgi:signal transduction histidine kinase
LELDEEIVEAPEAEPETPRVRAALGHLEDRHSTRRVLAMRILFLVGLIAWSSLAAWWATYFYRSSIEVRHAILRAYSAEERLSVVELEQRALDEGSARQELGGTVFTIASLPLSADEEAYPHEVLRGRLSGKAITVDATERQRLKTELHRKMVMLAGEGSLLVGLLFACLLALYRMLMGELNLRRHQESFVHSVTHELKSPLAGLRSLLQTLAALEIPKAERTTYAELGVREIDRLDHLVANILLSSKLEAESFRPVISDVDIGGILASVREAKLHVFQERSGGIELAASKDAVAKGDGEAVETILSNLVDNALKYSRGKPHVRLSTRREGRWLRVDVTDHGIGLSPQEAARVFQKFYRAPPGEQQHAKGSGLGLFIARGLAQSLGGRLSVQSEGPGKGSTFTLSLPV